MSQFLASSLIGWRRWSYLPSVVSMVTGPSRFFFQRCPARDHLSTQPTLPTFRQKVKLVQADTSVRFEGHGGSFHSHKRRLISQLLGSTVECPRASAHDRRTLLFYVKEWSKFIAVLKVWTSCYSVF